MRRMCGESRAPNLRRLAKEIGREHDLAGELWRTGIHDARILATLIDDPAQVTVRQMEQWAADFNSWAVCDAACCCLFDKTPHAWGKAVEWTEREEEYVKRAGFVLMAALAVHDKKAPDEQFEAFLPLIARHATDERNFVKKAVNWALRQIGKRNRRLNASRHSNGSGDPPDRLPSRPVDRVRRPAGTDLRESPTAPQTVGAGLKPTPTSFFSWLRASRPLAAGGSPVGSPTRRFDG